MKYKTVSWETDKIRLIDQTKLPRELAYLDCSNIEELWHAIKHLIVRGAPALGVVAGWGVYLGLRESKAKTFEEFFRELESTAAYLASSRPTAVNLFWGIERMKKVALDNKGRSVEEIKRRLFEEAKTIQKEDENLCMAIGEAGEELIKTGDNILTHCNAGFLATAGIGTALGVLYTAHERGKRFHVYADETRPLLQGARLSTWELSSSGIKVTLICDNMAGFLMKQGKVDKVIVGADRIARNGDTANKIGTYSVACLANHHKIPFYVAAPYSTFDLSIPDGSHIPIEERDPREVTEGLGRRIAPEGVEVYNPAFDVTPHSLITAFVTERGIIKPPYEKTIKRSS